MTEREQLERYGLKWNGPTSFIPTEMSDGYWTPWHLADEVIKQQAAQIEKLRCFAQAVLANGIYGFDARRLPELATVYGLITTTYRSYGPTGNETMHAETYATELLVGDTK